MGLGRADLLPQSRAVTTFGPCGFGEEIVLSRRGLGAMEVLPLKWVPQVPRIWGRETTYPSQSFPVSEERTRLQVR